MSSTELIRIPAGAAKYILFQRTQYLFIRRNKTAQRTLRSLPKVIAFPLETLLTKFDKVVALEGLLAKNKIARLFSEEMEHEYDEMKPFLPKSAKAILDIGAGVGGIDILLARHYRKDNPAVCLIDRTEMPKKVYYSFKDKACYYNSLEITKGLLAENGVPAEKIFLQEATDDGSIGFNMSFDLIVSLISWGFHYPVSTYLETAYQKLNSGGVLILDVRKSQGGIDLIRKRFGNAEVIYSGAKHDRVLAKKA
jgi:SAM-dependent methyltransferase